MKLSSIIIPTFNKVGLLQECLAFAQKNTATPLEMIVVDNGSTDGTTEFCRRQPVTLISCPQNLGFPAACNLGLSVANGNALMLLNNDVLLPPHAVKYLLRCLYQDEKTGIVGPLTNFASGVQQVKRPYTNLEEMASHYRLRYRKKSLEVKRIVGLCFLIKRELYETIGGFDERFSPGYYEDDDYCFRARQAGFTLRVALDTFVFHYGSASFQEHGDDRLGQLLARNRQQFIDKWQVEPEVFMQDADGKERFF